MAKHFDCIVIGGGSAGYAAARTAKAASKSVAIVDGAGELGGLCILRGCMPSKTLIYTAEILHSARRGAEFGLRIPDASADMEIVQARKKEIIEDFARYRQEQLQSDAFELFRDCARFIDEKTIELCESSQQLTAGFFVLATGSVQHWPNIPGLKQEGVWTSDDVLNLDFLPQSVAVLGGGVVACELAQYLRRMGSQVTLIQRSARVLKEMSHEAAVVAESVFNEEGIRVYTGTHCTDIRKTGAGFAIDFEHLDKPVTVNVAHVFNAMGRRANTVGLDLDRAGVECGPNGQVRTNEYQQTTNPRIYAAGDVSGPVEIVHVAIMQGELAALHACGKKAEPVNYDNLTQVVFTDPQIASAGLTEDQLKERGIQYRKATYPFDDHGKSILMGAKHGYVSVFAREGDGLILGAECVGKDAGELIHSMAVAVAMKAHCAHLLKAHWYHPTLSEIWTYPLEDLHELCE